MLTREKYIKRPVEIEFELLYFFKKNESLIFFDIGACEAEDSIRYSLLFPNARIFAFEPRKDNCEKAIDLIKKYKVTNIVLENIALSNKNGVADFFLSEGEPDDFKNNENWNYGNKSSSLLAPTDEIKNHTSWISFNKKIEVKTQRLDDYVADKAISQIDFMHIDVQGAERMVLEGSGNFIDKIKMIWTEVEAVQLYSGQPLKADILKYMQENNFINILDTVNEVTGDQLYINRSHFSEEKIKSIFAERKKVNFIYKLKSFLKF